MPTSAAPAMHCPGSLRFSPDRLPSPREPHPSPEVRPRDRLPGTCRQAPCPTSRPAAPSRWQRCPTATPRVHSFAARLDLSCVPRAPPGPTRRRTTPAIWLAGCLPLFGRGSRCRRAADRELGQTSVRLEPRHTWHLLSGSRIAQPGHCPCTTCLSWGDGALRYHRAGGIVPQGARDREAVKT